MTIQEAVRSGKRFKRKAWGGYLYADPCDGLIHNEVGTAALCSEDILATDWEVEIVKKELSAEDIRVAYIKTVSESTYRSHIYMLKSFLKNLGLE